MTAAGIPIRYRHLMGRWLDRLVRSGWLVERAEAFARNPAVPAPALDPCLAEAERVLAGDRALFNYVSHCGSKLTAVLAGRESPLETLFPGGSFELAEALYEQSHSARYANAVVAAAIDGYVRSWTADRPLRLMEVGAGTGGTTSSILPLLPADRSVYQFTDTSTLFLQRAAARFGQYPFLRFGTFDLEKAPTAQGYAPESVDVMIAANVVHAVRSLDAALGHLRTLLRPGGLLVLLESTRHHAWFDFTTGLIEGWQQFSDRWRGDDPLLPPDAWIQVLTENGFASASAFPGPGSAAEALGQHVLLARRPGSATSAAATDLADRAGVVGAGSPSPGAAPAGAAAERGPQAADEFRARWAAALGDERRDLLMEFVRREVMAVLGLASDQRPAGRQRLMDLGLDSLMAVQLRNQLEKGLGLGRVMPATLMFDYPNIESIAQFLSEQLERNVGGAADAPGTAAETPAGESPSPLAASTVEQLTEAEAEALLEQRLRESGLD
jgi:SAM-dependent methyltransferase